MIPATELKRVDAADVLKAGRRAATLRRTPDGVVFAYLADYLADRRPAVGTTLPLTADPQVHRAGAVPPFFAGLLPEGRRLSAVRRAVKTSADDDLTLLLAVGSDAIGDVQVVPAGEPPGEDFAIAVADWRGLTFAELLGRAYGEGALALLSLPGVQDKMSARMLSLPVAGGFILKLDPPEFPHLVANEAFFLDAARRSGLAAAGAEVVRDAEGQPGLLVRRFDRVADAEGRVHSVAQEDGCQVLGRYPADKYRVTAEEVVTGLARTARARPVAALELLRQLTFAYLTGNGDAHAKNFSVQRLDDEWRITPAYDLPSSHPYGDFTMALQLGGRADAGLGRAAFEAFGATVGLRPPAVRRVLAELAAAVDAWIADLDALPFDERRIHRLRRFILDRRSKLAGAAAQG